MADFKLNFEKGKRRVSRTKKEQVSDSQLFPNTFSIIDKCISIYFSVHTRISDDNQPALDNYAPLIVLWRWRIYQSPSPTAQRIKCLTQMPQIQDQIYKIPMNS